MDNYRPKPVARCDGQTLWVWGEGETARAVIAAEEPASAQGARPLVAVLAHLDPNEWDWQWPQDAATD